MYSTISSISFFVNQLYRHLAEKFLTIMMIVLKHYKNIQLVLIRWKKKQMTFMMIVLITTKLAHLFWNTENKIAIMRIVMKHYKTAWSCWNTKKTLKVMMVVLKHYRNGPLVLKHWKKWIVILSIVMKHYKNGQVVLKH